MEKRIKILIADDHKLFNDGMKLMLSMEAEIDIVGQVYSGKDVLHHVNVLKPDIILLDINMPHVNGLDVAAKVIQDLPKVKIIILTMYSDKKFVDDCLAMGVHGFVLKSSGVDVVLMAIETVLNNGQFYEPKMNPKNFDNRHATDEFMRQFQLTKREIEIIGLIGQSNTNDEIAEKLFLSIATVKTHRNNINLKLDIKKPADLVKFAVEHGLV